jgi:hypothetical protein
MKNFDLHAVPGKTYFGTRIIAVFPEEGIKNGTFRAVGVMECARCSGRMIINGHFATGETLPSGYTPEVCELVKNNVMECEDCHDWQVS